MADQDYPDLYADMEASAQRTRAAAIAFEHVLGGPEADMVPVNGYPNQPTIAGRVKARLDPLVGTIESAAESVKRFAGVHATPPTTRYDGSALQPGDEYQSTPAQGGLRFTWSGSEWVVLNASVQQLAARLASVQGSGDVGHAGGTVASALAEQDTRLAQALYKGEVLDPGTSAEGTSVTRGYVHGYYPYRAGALRIGGSDLTALNDERGFWRGLPSQVAWDPVNIGLFSTAFNRNGASFGSYSNTWGHDCVTYGTASGAGGAGSATGNPDTPNDPFAGYCSWTWGKNNLAAGQKCAALGEENVVNTRAAMGFGYANSLQPSVATPDPVGASAIGSGNNVTGQAHAFGDFNSVADGIAIGDRVQGAPNEVTLGYRSTAFRAQKPAVPGDRGHVGINRTRNLDHEVNVDLGGGQSLAITSDSFAGSRIKLQGVKSDGSSQPIVDIIWSNPNSGSSLGELNISMNGRSTVAFSLKEDGTPVFGELKAAGQLQYPVKGAVYVDGGVLKVMP